MSTITAVLVADPDGTLRLTLPPDLHGSRIRIEARFAQLTMQSVSAGVLRKATALRRVRRLKLGDAIIATTAFETGSELVTRNEQEFHGIDR